MRRKSIPQAKKPHKFKNRMSRREIAEIFNDIVTFKIDQSKVDEISKGIIHRKIQTVYRWKSKKAKADCIRLARWWVFDLIHRVGFYKIKQSPRLYQALALKVMPERIEIEKFIRQ